MFLLNHLKQTDLPHEISNAFMVGLGNTPTFLMVGSTRRGIWQGQGQLKYHPPMLVLGVVRHCGKQLVFLWVIHSAVPTSSLWLGSVGGKVGKALKLMSQITILWWERGHVCIPLLPLLKPLCTHLPDVTIIKRVGEQHLDGQLWWLTRIQQLVSLVSPVCSYANH